MAQFAAVLKATIDRIGDHTPPIRNQVYQRARAALATRLDGVGPAPKVIVERHERLLEDAIAEVESFYAEPIEDDDPLAELADIVEANILEEQQRPNDRYHGSTAEGDVPPSIYIEGLATPAKSATLTLVPDASQMEQSSYFRDIVARTAQQSDGSVRSKFETSGKATGLVDHRLGGLLWDEPRTAEPVSLGRQQVHKLEWANSGLCCLCNKWALCVDQSACWQRDNSVEQMQRPVQGSANRYRSIRAAVWEKLWGHNDRANSHSITRTDEAQGRSNMLRHDLISEHA